MGNASNPGDSEPCPTCGGTGCPVCKGTGVASERVGRWGRGYRDDSSETVDVGSGQSVDTAGRDADAPGGRPAPAGSGRRIGGRPFVVVVGTGVVGAMLLSDGTVATPLLGFGLGLLVGVVVLALGRVLGR